MQIGVVVPKADVKLPEAAEQVWARLSTTPFLKMEMGAGAITGAGTRTFN